MTYHMKLILTQILYLHIVITPLAKEKWVMVLDDTSPNANIYDLTDYHFDFKIHTRINLNNVDDIWMVPLTSLAAPFYVIVTKNYSGSNVVDDIYIDNTIAYIVFRMNKWGDTFLPPSN